MPIAPSIPDRGRIEVYRCEDLYSRMCERANPAGGAPVLTEVAGSSVLLPAERRFARVADLDRYINAVRAAADVDVWPDKVPDVAVRQRRGVDRAHWEAPGTIAIPNSTQMLREHIVLHEIAHHLDHHTRVDAAPAHGPAFRWKLVQLHRVATGPVGGWALSVLFDQFFPADLTVHQPRST
jgi:putative metallohydrolase (TIGR04338 family)